MSVGKELLAKAKQVQYRRNDELSNRLYHEILISLTAAAETGMTAYNLTKEEFPELYGNVDMVDMLTKLLDKEDIKLVYLYPHQDLYAIRLEYD